MINLMYDFINRFISYEDASNEDSLDLLFGTSAWRSLRTSPNRESALVSLYVEQVRAAGDFKYVTFSRILKPLVERAYFHLVYATRNGKGVEKFREVEKKVVTEQEKIRPEVQRYHREDRSGQTEMDFGAAPPSRLLLGDRSQQLELAERKLNLLLQDGPMLYQDLQPQILEIPLVWASDLNRILSDRFEILGLGPKGRTPKFGCLVRIRT